MINETTEVSVMFSYKNEFALRLFRFTNPFLFRFHVSLI